MNDNAFLLLFIAFIALMSIVPFSLRKFGIPSVISLLVVGIIVGPTGIGLDLIKSGFDYFAGGGVAMSDNKKSKEYQGDINDLARKAGYYHYHNRADVLKHSSRSRIGV